jgi:hypothetical protein
MTGSGDAAVSPYTCITVLTDKCEHRLMDSGGQELRHKKRRVGRSSNPSLFMFSPSLYRANLHTRFASLWIAFYLAMTAFIFDFIFLTPESFPLASFLLLPDS